MDGNDAENSSATFCGPLDDATGTLWMETYNHSIAQDNSGDLAAISGTVILEDIKSNA